MVGLVFLRFTLQLGCDAKPPFRRESPDRSGGCVSRSLFQDGAVLSRHGGVGGIPARRSNGLARAGRAAEREISAQAEVINHLAEAAAAAATQKQRRRSASGPKCGRGYAGVPTYPLTERS
ncbi:Uncharacterized protein DBV15_11643 [Temnothorax longispinosus]|uniref:Uncharacterized protein n=1 Tax=Temnothorax longispinosus TaxID=300112 RepID=A0A4S2KSL5_9HYME|nr:Uncharacterized protein DBV15_11643 [Temnothorax longispinosus]